MTTADLGRSEELRQAATLVQSWTAPYAQPLAALLAAEADHADHIGRDNDSWDRYPDGAPVLAIARAINEATP